MKSSVNLKRPWTPEEDRVIFKGVEDKKTWTEISKLLVDRCNQHVKNRKIALYRAVKREAKKTAMKATTAVKAINKNANKAVKAVKANRKKVKKSST